MPTHDQPLHPLAALIARIQHRWGNRALQPAHQVVRPQGMLPTGIVVLDTLLAGGLPRSAMTELLSAPTSGAATLAYMTLAYTQSQGGLVAILDLPGTFDAMYAVACGIDLAALLLVRPDTPQAALDMLIRLASETALDCILVDGLATLQAIPGGVALLTVGLRRLQSALKSSYCAVLILTALPYQATQIQSIGFHGTLIGDATTLRLHLVRETWEDHAAPLACHSRLTVLRMRGASTQQAISLRILFPPQGNYL